MELDKNIKSAIMFGRGRPFNGVLIQPSSFDELRRLGTEGFINEIWFGILFYFHFISYWFLIGLPFKLLIRLLRRTLEYLKRYDFCY